MFNYTYDKDGIYIANLANKGEKYSLTQYRFLDEKTVRVRRSPNVSPKNGLPYKATKINYPILLVDIWGYGTFYSDVPATLERCIFLQDFDHMMTLGLIYCGGELPMPVSGYAKYVDIDESFDKDSVAGNS